MSDFLELQMTISPELRRVLNLVTNSGKFFGRPHADLVLETLVKELHIERCDGDDAEAIILDLIPSLEAELKSPTGGFDPPGNSIVAPIVNQYGLQFMRNGLVQFGQRHRRLETKPTIDALETEVRDALRHFLVEKVNLMLKRWNNRLERDDKRNARRRQSAS